MLALCCDYRVATHSAKARIGLNEVALGLRFPARILRHTLGGILAAPHPAAHSPQVGWLTDACMGVSVAHADGSTSSTTQESA